MEPIIAGFHPDPSICRAGEDYYLVNSSFEYWPGIPVWHSVDLTNWEQIGNAMATGSRVGGDPRPSGGIFAPTIRYHHGTFWIITTDVDAGGGQIVLSAKDPRGPWSAPIPIEGLVGIDPDLVWDGDDCLVTYCSTDRTRPGISQAQVDLAIGRVLEPPRRVWGGTGLAYPEAPHLYSHDDWWYLILAEGGTERGHCVTVARSRSPRGPFEPHPDNPIFTHRSTTHPVQNVGHADLVERADGEWAAVHLGVRASGVTPMFHANGRETFLAGVRWTDGWPQFDENRYDLTVPDRSFGDTFRDDVHPRWVSPGAPIEQQLFPTADGVEVCSPSDEQDPRNAIVARVTDRHWKFSAIVERLDGIAAAVLRLDDAHWVEVRAHRDTGAQAVMRIGPLVQSLGSAVDLTSDPVELIIESVPTSNGGPDELLFAIEQDGRRHSLGAADGRYLSTEVAGGFTGRVVGVRALTGRFLLRSVAYTAYDA